MRVRVRTTDLARLNIKDDFIVLGAVLYLLGLSRHTRHGVHERNTQVIGGTSLEMGGGGWNMEETTNTLAIGS